MNRYFIESFKIDKLWGYLDMNLIFEPDVNILIGPNGSGKTTVLNLLHSILSADLRSILDINFDQAVIKLKSFDEKSVRTVKVEVADGLLKLSVGRTKFEIDIDILSGRRVHRLALLEEKGDIISRILPKKLYDELTALVPIVWLPASRRLSVTEGGDEQYTGTDSVKSVDVQLRKLLEGFSRYHSILNAQFSKLYEEFGHRVLSEILYSEKHDQLDLSPPSLPTEAEKEQLLGAFEAAGFLDEQMRIRIDEHFAVAEEALKRIGQTPTVLEGKDALVLSLVRRTKAIVKYARKLEEDRERMFTPLRRYENTVNSFLNDKKTADSFLDEKSVKVDEDGELKIESSVHQNLDPLVLSSGEKQILILLTEALLRAYEPVVYIADEPELSLHISWQRKLLRSLVELGGQKQVIVATHSPDIIGRFVDNVIDLGGGQLMSFSRTPRGLAARYLFNYARHYSDISYSLIRQDPRLKKKPKFDWAGALKALRDQYTSVELQKVASDLRIRGSLEPTWKHYNTMENALIKDGWTITDDWLRLQRSKDLYVDLSGKQFLTAEKENRKMAVLVKSFNGPSDIADLQNALGQYTLYRNIIEETEPDRTLYLAVHEETFATIFEEALGQLTIRKNDLKLIVFNKTEEAIVKWNA